MKNPKFPHCVSYLILTNSSISLSPRSNLSNLVNLAKELGMEPIKFSLSSNEVKFVKLQKSTKMH